MKVLTKSTIIVYLFIWLTYPAKAQNDSIALQKVLRVNVLNPGIDVEVPLSHKTAFSANVGWGLGGGRDLEDEPGGLGWQYMLLPFVDLEYKYIYNRQKRLRKEKNLAYNTGNYVGIRFLTRGKATKSYHISRADTKDFAIAPVWGFQRTNNAMHFLFDIGLAYAFNSKGHSRVIPLIQFNVGLNVSRLFW